MKAAHFESLLQELIDENPFAIRAALQILKVEFTEAVATLAVTCEAKPRMLVNLGFLARHAHTEVQVKAVVVHEFLHVLLRHTEGRQPLTYARHLAFDAVINAIIHRQYGEAYSSMMATYYAESRGLQKLL
jgi:predicted metal-dependent peptidase